MIRNRLIALAAALSLTAVACATPTEIPAPVNAAEPRFEGGMGYGSGNRSGGDTTTVIHTEDSEHAAAPDGQTLLPGMGYGSGN